MIVVDKVSKFFGDVTAVDDVSFTVDRGEILGFLGPNGAGKTTTMRVLTCFFPPSVGTAQVAGFDILKESLQVRRNVGYLPENVPLYNDMAVESYLHFAAEVKGVAGRDRKKRVQEVMDECALQEVADFPIGKVSRGYRQRVGLAQAIISRPPVLILDEPTVGLDPQQIIEVRTLIKRLAEKATVILSTHILPEVSLLCNRVVIISNGRVQAIDTPENLGAQMRKAVLVDVVVEGADAGRVCESLKKIEGVRRVDARDDATQGTRFVVEATRDRDVRRDIAARVVQADWGLLELRQQEMSIEDIYVQIVTDDSNPAPDADEKHKSRKGSPKKDAAQSAPTTEKEEAN